MGDAVFIPNHKAISIARLLSQWRDKPRIVSLIRALAVGVQALEDDAFGVLVSTTLTAATNNDLDHWGALVGERRGGLDDQRYRTFIEARILANQSKGSRDELIRILQIISAPSTVTHTVTFPAAFQFVILRPEYMGDLHRRRVSETMNAIKPGGVAMLLFEAVPGEYYGFDPDPDALPLDVGLFSRLI